MNGPGETRRGEYYIAGEGLAALKQYAITAIEFVFVYFSGVLPRPRRVKTAICVRAFRANEVRASLWTQ